MSSGRVKTAAWAAVLAVFVASWIQPPWPQEQALHSSLTVLALAGLALHARRWPMRDGDFVAICGFIAVHCVAARWLYSYVPYDAWAQATTGWSPQLAFGWERNHTDRLIHFLYGACFAAPVQQHLRQRWPGLGAQAAFVLAVMAVMCSSLLYEWFEWLIALLLSPDAAETYNGQQGDVWDAHMDMALATLGAMLSWLWLDRAPRAREPAFA